MFSHCYSVNELPGDTKQSGDGECEDEVGREWRGHFDRLFDILYLFNALAEPLGQSSNGCEVF